MLIVLVNIKINEMTNQINLLLTEAKHEFQCDASILTMKKCEVGSKTSHICQLFTKEMLNGQLLYPVMQTTQPFQMKNIGFKVNHVIH